MEKLENQKINFSEDLTKIVSQQKSNVPPKTSLADNNLKSHYMGGFCGRKRV